MRRRVPSRAFMDDRHRGLAARRRLRLSTLQRAIGFHRGTFFLHPALGRAGIT